MDKEMFSKLAGKMGITSQKILSQAEEYVRLSHIKCTGLTNVTATSRSVICLEMAANAMRFPLDKDYVTKLSGVNKKVYQSNLKSMECMLGVESHPGLRELAVQYGCIQAVTPAAQILQRYEASLPEAQRADVDLSKPLFTTAALLTACRCLKIKVDKKLGSSSGVKKGMLDRLCGQLQRFGQEICSEASLALKEKSKPTQKRQRTLLESLEQEEEGPELPTSPKQQRDDPDEGTKQNYQEWKRKILEKALKTQQGSS